MAPPPHHGTPPTLDTQLPKFLHHVAVAADTLAEGGALLIADDGSRENEIDLVFAASLATPQMVNLALTQARGLLCVAMGPQKALQCGLCRAPQFPSNVPHTHFTQSVDALKGIGSGISAKDRCTTIRLLGAPLATPWDFLSPGHVFPVQGATGGLLERAGHTEACVELCRVAGIQEAAVMCEILDDSGEALPANGLHRLPPDHPFCSLPMVTTAQLFWHGLCLGELLDQQEVLAWKFRGEEEGWACHPQSPTGTFVPATLRGQAHGAQSLHVLWGAHEATSLGGWTLSLWSTPEPLPPHWDQAVDLSRKEGVRIHNALQNLLTILVATRRLAALWGTPWLQVIGETKGCEAYKECLMAWVQLSDTSSQKDAPSPPSLSHWLDQNRGEHPCPLP